MRPVPPGSTLFPYTTLFRSVVEHRPESSRGELLQPRRGLGEPQQALRRSEEHTSELQSHSDLVCRLLLEKKNRRRSALSSRPRSTPAPRRVDHEAPATHDRL